MDLALAQFTERGSLEKYLVQSGSLPAGVDEVGRGCIAGPVYTACVVLNYEKLWSLPLKDQALIRDSKRLSSTQREKLIPVIHQISLYTQISFAAVREIESLGIADATFLAMRRSIQPAKSLFSTLLVDGNQKIRGYDGEQITVIKGDNLCFAIAAASILAKTARDQFMLEMAKDFPVYGFDNHVGYGTKQHLTSLAEHGYCALHRRNFEPVRSMVTP